MARCARQPEDCIVPEDDDGNQPNRLSRDPGRPCPAPSRAPRPSPGVPSYGPNIPAELGRPPPPEVARMLFMTYFQTWHRFFPFLHGPTDREPSLPLARAIILQCLFNLSSLYEKVQLPAISRIDRPIKFLSYFLELATKGDISSIQALVAVELLLVARMSSRAAVVVAGLLSRAIFLAGLHRCPIRYRELSVDDCDIRKRLFWTIYVLDRFLSLKPLGTP
ncbi:hypothetical protein S40288_09074 [Stachybotrys chartarum IBT 40288]|nr:hypothetical protein S40288_09074 [Stachybotrys chartarum IBT 40288]